MLRFRTPISLPFLPVPAESPLTLDVVGQLAAFALSPGHFFLAPDMDLERETVESEELAWEVFRGRLLDPAHTRQRRTFRAWNLYLIDETVRSGLPLLSLKLDEAERTLHVVRGLLCYVHEAYDEGNNVILTRETTRWVRELAGSISLDRFENAGHLLDELAARLFHAVVGASRLPLTSVEAPLPSFSLGKLVYCLRPDLPLAGTSRPLRKWDEWLNLLRGVNLAERERSRLMETLLLAVPVAKQAKLGPDPFGDKPREGEPTPALSLLPRMFNGAALSPWTDLANRALLYLQTLDRPNGVKTVEAVDVIAKLLRQLGRHLTAYDLITFHHRGANYPDALLLDALLRQYLWYLERNPGLFHGSERQHRRRRALRQASFLRRFYEGHPVPDEPTSPGESTRVLPDRPRVPEEQILQPNKRRRRLYDGEPLSKVLGSHRSAALQQSLADLRLPDELRELGTALFLDRPLGIGKQPGEPDQTILLSHRCFSRSVARQRLQLLAGYPEFALPSDLLAELTQRLEKMEPGGIPVTSLASRSRPGAVAIADAFQVAGDFVVLGTTRQTVAEFFRQYDFRPVLERVDVDPGSVSILPGSSPDVLVAHGPAGPLFEMRLNLAEGYGSWGGDEYLVGGFRVRVNGEQFNIRPV